MIDALITGKLIRDPMAKTGQSGKAYCNFLLSVPTGDEQPVIVSGIAFGETAERIGNLKKGDALTVTGTLKPSSWTDKTTGETKTGLSITVSSCLSAYDVAKRRKKPDSQADAGAQGGYRGQEPFYNDSIPF
jgi:single-stranded DNA-binding protein